MIYNLGGMSHRNPGSFRTEVSPGHWCKDFSLGNWVSPSQHHYTHSVSGKVSLLPWDLSMTKTTDFSVRTSEASGVTPPSIHHHAEPQVSHPEKGEVDLGSLRFFLFPKMGFPMTNSGFQTLRNSTLAVANVGVGHDNQNTLIWWHLAILSG